MMAITIQQAQSNLADVIHQLTPGEEVVITENERTVAKLVAPASGALEAAQKPRQFGTLRGTVLSMEHFDDPLEDFAEYR
jgi:antitoxin (DNA-binding transcriptional repressor) of toxin-antitoxin stability system